MSYLLHRLQFQELKKVNMPHNIDERNYLANEDFGMKSVGRQITLQGLASDIKYFLQPIRCLAHHVCLNYKIETESDLRKIYTFLKLIYISILYKITCNF